METIIIHLKTGENVTLIPHIGIVRKGIIIERQASETPIKDDLELSKIKGIGNIRGRQILNWIDVNKDKIKIIY